jgi:hypothetical protein
MTDPQIHPIALLAIGWYYCWIGKQKPTIDSIIGECLGLLFWLAMHPLVKWLVGECFEGNIEIISFGVYFKFMSMFMLGRVVEWFKVRTDDEK